MGNLRYSLNQLVKTQTARPQLSAVRRAYTFDERAYWAYVIERFAEVYTYALTHVQYYREAQYPKINFATLTDRESLYAALGDLPVLAKQTVKAKNDSFLAKKTLLRADHTTSGTTGSPLTIRSSLHEKAHLYAIKHTWYEHVGASVFPKVMLLSGGYVPKGDEIGAITPLIGHLRVSIYDLVPENRARIMALMLRVRPRVISGYASAVHLLAKVFAEESYPHRDETVAIVTAETLREDWRATIERQLAGTLRNYYSSQEGAVGAFEMVPGKMSLHPHVGIMECLDPDDQLVLGGTGRAVITGLLRRSMPLIRYDIGDQVEGLSFTPDPATGVQWPYIERVAGRSEDLVLTRSGARVGYLAFHSTKAVKEITEAQIIQRNYDRFEVCLVLEDGAERGRVEAHIREELTQRLKTELRLSFSYHTQIPRGANAKFKAVVVDFDPK